MCFGPDSLELLGVRLEDPRRAKAFEVQQGVLVAMQSIQVRRHQHLIIKTIKGVVEWDIVIAKLNTNIAK